MRKIIIVLLSVFLIILLFGCDDTGAGDGDGILKDFDFNLDSEGAMANDNSRAVEDADLNGIKISFRSSDIEFWASGGDFSNLASYKYYEGESASGNNDLNISSEIELSDTEDNVVFMPNHIKIGDDYILPSIDINSVYDVARLDIGGGIGSSDYSKDGEGINISNPFELNCNSIIMIDRNLMPVIHYMPRPLMYEIRSGTGADFGNDSDFLNTFVRSNENIDMDGALFIPYDPIDIKGNGNISKIKLKIRWAIDDIFSSVENDVYTLNMEADGTPYDFEFIVELH